MIGAGGFGTALAALFLDRAVEGAEAAPLPEVVLEWFGAWSSDDPARSVAALYADDATFEDIPSGAYILSPDIEQYLQSAPVRPTTVNRYPRGTYVVDGFAVAEQLFYATNESFAPGAPAGAPFEVFAVTVFEYDERALHRSADYYDFASILRQIGVLVPTVSTGESCVEAKRHGSASLAWA
jgi:hypothetical protein